MLRKLKNVLVPAALLSLVLAGCGTDSGTQSNPGSTDSSNSSEQPETPQPGTAEGPLPEVSGTFATDAELTFPADAPSAELVVEVITEGDGPELGAADTFSSHYLGQVWGGEIFDQSYDKGAPLTIGLGSLVQGWQQGLPGLKMGSRVLLSIPPHLGYPGGNSAAGIGAEDTLVFVVDLLEILPSQGDANAVPTEDAASITSVITGALGGPAAISIPEGATAPTETTTTVLAEGTGPVVEQAFYAQYALTLWDGSYAESSWDLNLGPQQLHIFHPYFADFAGIPAGSRVLVEIPASEEEPTALAIVADITYVPEN